MPRGKIRTTTVTRRDGQQFEVIDGSEMSHDFIEKKMARVATALALLQPDDGENPLSGNRWNARQAYGITLAATFPWIHDGELAKIAGISLPWVRNHRYQPEFRQAVLRMIQITNKALGVQVDALKTQALDIIRDRLNNPDEDKRYDAAVLIAKSTNLLSPDPDGEALTKPVINIFTGMPLDQIARFKEIAETLREPEKDVTPSPVEQLETAEVANG